MRRYPSELSQAAIEFLVSREMTKCECKGIFFTAQDDLRCRIQVIVR